MAERLVLYTSTEIWRSGFGSGGRFVPGARACSEPTPEDVFERDSRALSRDWTKGKIASNS